MGTKTGVVLLLSTILISIELSSAMDNILGTNTPPNSVITGCNWGVCVTLYQDSIPFIIEVALGIIVLLILVIIYLIRKKKHPV